MKRVVIITNIPSPYRVDLFDYLRKHTTEYEIYILYASRNEDNRQWKIEREKLVNSRFLDSYTIKIPRRYDTKYIHISKGVGSELARIQPDLVVGSEYNPTVLQALQYCRRRQIPYISWTDGTLHSERNINKIQRWLRIWVIKHASAYIASSTKSQEAQLAYGAKEESCFISFLTVDIEKYLVEQQDIQPARMIYVGSLIERKGVDLLLKALNGLKGDYTLVLAGDGPEKKNLQKLAEDLGIASHVEFLGYLSQEKLREEYAKSSLFVLPTREDCFALVILEAMCAGLPVVSSVYADGAYDLVEEGENGYLVDPFDTEKLQEYLQELLDHPEQANKMGQASRDIVSKFRFEEVSKGFYDAFAYVSRKEN